MSSDSSKPALGAAFAPKGPAVPWGPVSSAVFTVVAFFVAQALASILFVGLGGRGLGPIGGQFLFVVLSDALIIGALWLFVRRWKESLRLLGFGRRPLWRDLGLACLAYLAYFGLLLVMLQVADAFTPINLDQRQEIGFENLIGTSEVLMALISLVLLPPIVEEVVFRGFLFSGMRKRLSFGWAMAITSVLFAAPHLLASSEGLLWVAGIDTLVLSFVLCYLREKTGALWAPIVVHGLKNSVAFVLLLAGVAAI